MSALKNASLALALALWALPLQATTCPPDIAALGTVQDGYRTSWFRGTYVSGPVTRTGWGFLGRRYSIPATVVKLDALGSTIERETGTLDRFVFSQTIPLASAGTLVGFGALKVALLPQIFGVNAWDLARDYFGWLALSNPALFTAGGSLTLAGWNKMLARPYFRTDRARALDLPPAYLRALTITLSSRRPRAIKQNGIKYAPYHMVVYTNPEGTVTRMTLLTVPADAKNGTEMNEMDLVLAEEQE
jgi:hypothetical protein